jgi:ribosomal protein S18 acetylase RimI-like enzyme
VRLRPAGPDDADVCSVLVLEPPSGLHSIVRDPAARLEIARRTFLARGTAFGWERTLVAERDGTVLGMGARFLDHEWPRLRLRTGTVMLGAAGPRYVVPLLRRARIEERVMAPIPPGRCYVTSLAVLPDERRQGTGAMLLRAVAQEARGRGLAAVALDVASHNEAAIRFYRREGFVVVSECRLPATGSTPALGAIRMELALDG